MTPEEQLIQINNALHSITENLARHDAQMEKNDAQIEKNAVQIEKNSLQIEKNTAGIRDLIMVSRAILNAIKELREAQSDTEGKLNALIDTVDRIVRKDQGGPPPNPRP